MVEVEDGQIVEGTVVKVDKDEVLLDIGYKSEGVIPARELSIRNDVDPARDRQPRRQDRGPRPPEGGQGRPPGPLQEAGPVRAGVGHDREDQGRGRRRRAARSSRSSRAASSSTSACAASCRRRSSSCAGSATCSPTSAAASRPRSSSSTRTATTSCCRRRAWLEETQKEQREDFLANLKPGEVRKGVVSSVVNFGAFVDLGGMDGLIHVSELSWKHVDHPGSVVAVGDEVTVQVLDVDLDRERISLSLKATQQDPWQEFANDPPGRRAGLRPGHQARAVRRVRPGRRRHRGSRAHLGDVGAPRRPARAGRHPRRGAVGQDHRPRPRPPPHQPVDQAGRRGRRGGRGVPRALRRARLRRARATTSATTPRQYEQAWEEYEKSEGIEGGRRRPGRPTERRAPAAAARPTPADAAGRPTSPCADEARASDEPPADRTDRRPLDLTRRTGGPCRARPWRAPARAALNFPEAGSVSGSKRPTCSVREAAVRSPAPVRRLYDARSRSNGADGERDVRENAARPPGRRVVLVQGTRWV